MNGCRNILPVVAAVVALMLAVAACGHGARGTRCGGDIKIKIICIDYQRIKNALI